MFSSFALQRVYHVMSLVIVAVWAPWWVLLAWLFLVLGAHASVSPKRAELLLAFIPKEGRISRTELHRAVALAHGTDPWSLNLFFPLLVLRRRGLIEQFDELVSPEGAPDPGHPRPPLKEWMLEWESYYRRLS